MPRLPWACPMEDGQGIARWVRPIRRRVARRRSPFLQKRKSVVVRTSVERPGSWRLSTSRSSCARHFLWERTFSIQTFPTWHPKPVSGCRQERFCLGLRRTASRASEVSRLVHYSERSTISSREITSPRLLWVQLPWSVLLATGAPGRCGRPAARSRPGSQPF